MIRTSDCQLIENVSHVCCCNGRMNGTAPAAVSEFRAEAAQGRDELHSLRRHLRDVEAERDDFRRRHRLTRTARWATGGSLTLKIGVLLTLFVFEVFLNGFFLAKGSELGYVGGAAEALIFALLNIGVSFLAGAVGVRELNHRNFIRKLLGLISLVGYLAIALGLNLTLAHYREAAGSFVSDAGHEGPRECTFGGAFAVVVHGSRADRQDSVWGDGVQVNGPGRRAARDAPVFRPGQESAGTVLMTLPLVFTAR